MGNATVRYSLKTIAMNFPARTIERVYLHGMWQKERGRNPTMLYGNHTDPKDAFLSAALMVGPYIESIRKIPFSRYSNWSNAVEDIMNKKPVERLSL